MEIYTDGGYSIGRCIGGYACVFVRDGKYESVFQQELKNSTSNRAELYAFIYALEKSQEEKEVVIFTDSMYIVKGYNQWSKEWIKNNWKNKKGFALKNADLWRKVLTLIQDHIKVKWKKRNSCEFNKLADALSKF